MSARSPGLANGQGFRPAQPVAHGVSVRPMERYPSPFSCLRLAADSSNLRMCAIPAPSAPLRHQPTVRCLNGRYRRRERARKQGVSAGGAQVTTRGSAIGCLAAARGPGRRTTRLGGPCACEQIDFAARVRTRRGPRAFRSRLSYLDVSRFRQCVKESDDILSGCWRDRAGNATSDLPARPFYRRGLEEELVPPPGRAYGCFGPLG